MNNYLVSFSEDLKFYLKNRMGEVTANFFKKSFFKKKLCTIPFLILILIFFFQIITPKITNKKIKTNS